MCTEKHVLIYKMFTNGFNIGLLGTNVNEWKDNINNSATKIKKFISLLGAEML